MLQANERHESLSTQTCRWKTVSSELSRAASACYDSYAVSGDRYRPLSSSHWSSCWSSASFTTATVSWLDYLSTWSNVFSRFKTLQHGWFLVLEHITAALATSPVFTGCTFQRIYGRFAPSSVRPLDVSPPRRFAPWCLGFRLTE